MSLKLVWGLIGGELMVLYVGHIFNLWFSSSFALHVRHIALIVPLKFEPHSSILNLAMIMVLVSCLVQVSSSFCTLREKVGLSISSKICAVFVLGVRQSLTVL